VGAGAYPGEWQAIKGAFLRGSDPSLAARGPGSSELRSPGGSFPAMFVRGRGVSLGFVALAAIVSGGSCTGAADDATPMPARPGAQQPPAGGAAVDENTACTRLVAAEEKARHRLNCPELDRTACPFYVRPAGTGCWTYDEASLSACEDALSAYEFCSDFTGQRCVLTAEPADPGSCRALGAGGEGGEPGAAGGASGESGTAGAGG
jgi:hypothetical protein